MIYLKCTGEAQRAIGLAKNQLAEAQPVAAPLGSWYVHRFVADRTQFYLFMSEATLLSFVLYQGKKPVTAQTLPQMFLAGLSQLLTMRGLDESRVHRAVDACGSGFFAKTDNRKVLGCMNDLVRCFTTMVEVQGGLAECDLTAIIMKLNDMPQRTLNWTTSWDATMAALSDQSRVVH